MSDDGEFLRYFDLLVGTLERIEGHLERIADKPPSIDEIAYEKRRDI